MNHQNKYGDTPLMAACRAQNVHLVKTLLTNGANPRLKNEDKMTAFDCACISKNQEVSELLQKRGPK